MFSADSSNISEGCLQSGVMAGMSSRPGSACSYSSLFGIVKILLGQLLNNGYFDRLYIRHLVFLFKHECTFEHLELLQSVPPKSQRSHGTKLVHLSV